MPISLTIMLVIAAVVLIAFGIGSTGGAIRFLSGSAALVVAIAGTAATIGLFWVGHTNNWTSDGPGMLFVMLALVVSAIVAAVGWMFVLGVAATLAVPADALPDTPRGLKRVFLLLGVTLLAIAAVGQGIAAFNRRGRTPHSAPVVAVSFVTGRARLVTVDAGGTLVDWDLHAKREARRRRTPELAGVTELFVNPTLDGGFAIANGQAVRFAPFEGTPVETIPAARHIARGGAVVVAKERALLFVSYSDWRKPPYRELAWPEPITAIAARDGFVAVAGRASIALLDGRTNSVRRVASVPAPGAITGLQVLYDGTVLALDTSEGVWAIDVRRGVAEPLAAKASLVASDRHVFLVSGRAVSEYDPRQKSTTHVADIASGARSIDTWDKYVAFGLESGEVVLGTRSGATLETHRLTARPAER